MLVRLRSGRGVRDYGILISFLVLFAVLSLSTSTFLTEQNMANLLDQNAIFGILACAETLCIVSGVFDLSVSASLALSAIVAVSVGQADGSIAGFVAGTATGGLLGLVNGLVVTYGKVNSFIATLATSIIFRGLALVLTGGDIVTTNAGGFGVFGQNSGILGVTQASWLFLAVVLVTGVLLASTTYGRALYAVGGNLEAARLSGLRTGFVRTSVFALSGVLAGMAGLIEASRTSSAQASTGTGWELTAIAATIVGGTSILGGDGAIWRAVVGVFILALIGNGMNLASINSTYQQGVQGLLILFAVLADQWMRRRQ